MGFSRARTNEQKQQRIDAVVKATAHLYDTVSYDDITFAAIAKETGFARSNLYIYFTSKEEILLELLIHDLRSWSEDIGEAFHVRKSYTVEEVAEGWTNAYLKNKRLLSLLAILFTVLEKNVSTEALAQFKRKMMEVQHRVLELLGGLLPSIHEEVLEQFLINQLALVQGLYPMAFITERQKQAIEESGTGYVAPEFASSYLNVITALLKNLNKESIS
ncbi:TetR family transcriptional regulator [Bacillus carboniphilus]|uniref:TetR family transcriptional regulator n=1 Tax=Bacillus carboniphilus TaxID=86663 RepID=A0ABY9JXK9_9BACI|nr:TetR family transcriptional regulator [Bacillus carboniphilus]WLR43262.1 TetR family transcriptional regulator [Bacillus carboniphilus]